MVYFNVLHRNSLGRTEETTRILSLRSRRRGLKSNQVPPEGRPQTLPPGPSSSVFAAIKVVNK
jgi:hypothetical protein